MSLEINNLYQNIFNHSPVAKILIDNSKVIKILNNNAVQLFGYEKKELIGQPIEILVPKEYRESHEKLVNDFMDCPKAKQMGKGRNLYGVKKNETRFPIEVGLTPMQTKNGLYIMSSILDISDRLKAEERFRLAFEASPSGMVMIDSKGKITLVNQQIVNMFGYSEEELLNKPIEILVPNETQSKHPSLVQFFLKNPTPRAMGEGRELFGRKNDGTKIRVEIGLRPFMLGNELYVISIVVDITKRFLSEKIIKEKTEEIEQFAYRTSHDLRSPLFTIRGLLDCIDEDIDEGNIDEAKKNLIKGQQLVSKLNKLVEDILNLTKAGYSSDLKSEINIEEIIETSVSKLESDINISNIEVKTEFKHKKNLFLEKARIIQIIDNLISNSIKYSDLDKPFRFIFIKTYSDDSYFHFVIEDNGLGIPEKRKSEVFGMFKRFHEGSILGSGLGLYIVKKHLDKLSASIDFESSKLGTTFKISFKL